MQKKKGISLIVLVITIIVMIILAAAIIISLTNSGIINKANEAVSQTNLKQVQQIASLAWAEAYADGKTTEAELDAAVDAALVANKVDTSKYNVIVTESGVEVANKVGNTEKHGLYFGEIYKGQVSEGENSYYTGIVFYKTDVEGTATADIYIQGKADGITGEAGELMYYTVSIPVNYTDEQVIQDGVAINISDDGLKLFSEMTEMNCSIGELSDTTYGTPYVYTQTTDTGIARVEVIFNENSTITLTLTSGDSKVINGTLSATVSENGKSFDAGAETDNDISYRYLISADGKYALWVASPETYYLLELAKVGDEE